MNGLEHRHQSLIETLQVIADPDGPDYQKYLFIKFLLNRLARAVPIDFAAVYKGTTSAPYTFELDTEWPEQTSKIGGALPLADLNGLISQAGGIFPPSAPHQYSVELTYCHTTDNRPLRRLAVIPLCQKADTMGILCMGRVDDDPFTADEIDIASDLTLLIVTALNTQRKLSEQQALLQETQNLLDAAQSILASEDLPTLCQNLDIAFHRLAQADRTVLYLFDREKRQVIHWAAYGPFERELTFEEIDSGMSGMVMRTGKPVLSVDPYDGIEPEGTRQRRIDHGVGSIIVVPLIAQGKVIGTVTAANHKENRQFTQHDVNLLMVLATNATAAVNNVLSLEKLKTMSVQLRALSFQDALTGIFNRTYFEAEMKRLESYGNYPISVILMDVDGLKLVNDRHGHAAGDVLLKELARVIQDVFRAGDVAARIGGDEFGILLENMDEKGAKRAVDRLRSAIAAHNETSIKAAEDNPALEWSLSASIGSATSTARRHLTDILKEADTRMYQEKRDKKMQRIN